jgi:hypothetical protein
VPDPTESKAPSPPPLTEEERAIIDTVQADRKEPLTPQEIWLSLEQARALGVIDDTTEHDADSVSAGTP